MICSSKEPVRQKRRSLAPERRQVVTKEVEDWVKAGIVRQVRYPTWIHNPVLVKKSDGSCRMCIDFKDINKACPKDHYPLPEIDWKIESVMRFKYKCFLDAYKGYHQVQMYREDEEKMAFYTDQGTYCYTKMPFGLKNVGATYQRLVDKVFKDQIGRNLEAYVDDMVIKSRDEKGLLTDIEETFKTLRKINMKLNPKKCSFGMEEWKFLRYIVTSEGIRANPRKTNAIMDMQSPKSLKQMQTLSGKLAALNRFLSKGAERSLPFFDTLKGCTKDNFKWTEEAEQAFLEIKKHIAKLPLLTTPKPGEELFIYLSAAELAVNAMLVAEREGKQVPIHHVSRTLHDAKINYSPMEKLALSLLHASQRLKRETRLIGRGAWRFRDRIQTKKLRQGPSLSRFPRENAYRIGSTSTEEGDWENDGDVWTLFTDGSSGEEGAGAGWVLTSPDEVEYVYTLRLNFPSSNKESEYEAVLAADALSKLAATTFSELTKQVLVEVLNERSTELKEINSVVEEEGDTWMTLIIKCLEKDEWPEDPNERRKLRLKLPQYVMEDGVLFKKSYLVPMLRCVGPLQANYVIREIYMGSCGMHSGPRSVVAKSMRQGYYWPTMHADARQEIRKFGPLPEAPGRVKFILVAIDYFTKWVEAKPLAKISGKDVKILFGRTYLTYGSDVVIPAEIGMPTHRTMMINEALNNDELRLNLDLLPERKEMAAIKEAKYKKKMEQQYNKRVRPVSFRLGEYVYQRNEASRAENQGKLGPTWEGPYQILEAFQKGPYKLATMEGDEILRVWHAINLKKCYI
ncbi:reverse transcriptase domain-containing protein [Tanacetum coccineum]